MEDLLRPAVCYWHSFAWNGHDIFGQGTFDRPWNAGVMDQAAAWAKMDAAFDFFTTLGTPFYCFHDVDAMPAAANIKEHVANLAATIDRLEKKQAETGIKLLWGTANLFSHPRYMGGASTNPDPDVWAFAATQVRHCMDATKRLGGANYVLWGGREGYDTLLNTSLKHELANFGRFLQLVVEHKHKIGFKGTILIEPKPHEPTKHQYDFDTATVYGFLKKNGLENEVKVNIEANHATLAGHSFDHEIAMADALGIFGSIDINRGDPQNGWDTDQFHNDPLDMTLAMYRILKAGGFTTGGFNFDAKVRRQSHRPGRHVLRTRGRARPAGAHAAVGGGAHRERRHRQVRRAALRQVGGRGRARRFTPRVRRWNPSPMRRWRRTSIRSRSRAARNISRTWSTGSSDRFRGMAAHRVRPRRRPGREGLSFLPHAASCARRLAAAQSVEAMSSRRWPSSI